MTSLITSHQIPLLLIKCLEADFDSLLRQLRPGRTPTVHMPTTSDQLLRRVSNLMLRVSFDDEQQWAIRIRQQRDGPLSCYTPAFRAMTLRSEYATLKAMEGKGLPVPAVYGEDIYGELVIPSRRTEIYMLTIRARRS